MDKQKADALEGLSEMIGAVQAQRPGYVRLQRDTLLEILIKARSWVAAVPDIEITGKPYTHEPFRPHNQRDRL